MAIKAFIDANILLDLILKRERYHEAKQIFQSIEEDNIDGYITSSVLHITGYWTTKEYGTTKAKSILLSLLNVITVIDIRHETAQIALHSKIDDIEDALQYYTAIHHKLDYFITRDKQLKKDGTPALAVISPDDFITLMR
ncbi:MAG: type II toxin-antitoxin system VapC family toxin [Mucilaginibacter sp.]|nr:type II toxin-antitoxin system VapC family toxin [Mucilaginibacter sp.]